MEKVGIILLVLFLFIIVIGPLTCFKLSRDDKPKIYNPQPNQLEDARSKLRTYTTCSTVAQRTSEGCNDDVEAIAPPSEFGECPICIGPLIPEPVHTAGSDPPPVLEHVASVTSKNLGTTSEEQCMVEVGRTERPSGGADTRSMSETIDDDILTLNSCGHSFHSKCLSSWFLIERFDCPVCREPYYKTRPQRERIFSVPPFF
ncbi:hypothetical protein B0J13DRAFT_330589 [Dactylonectria estremocensis]|uniref:RING-type domain-containing protein n=1 Tax=Dactylonectria estremocensis TaxID=1079267 RepID=A0A9P9EWL9_9HYPO|nr:hypothetical protein B0J13DRAFT_330589 [Dactylonectria estremocensis]